MPTLIANGQPEMNRTGGWSPGSGSSPTASPDEDLALAYALLTPEPRGPHSPTNSPIRTTPQNFGRIPRVYIELTEDKAVCWPAQKRMYTATPCRVLSINSSHSAYFSQPDQLTNTS